MKMLGISKDSVYKIAIMGPDSVGKTTLIHRYCDGIFLGKTVPTIGVEFQILSVKTAGQVVRFQIWDVGGKKVFHSIWQSFIEGVQGIIFAFDISKKSSLEELEHQMVKFSFLDNTTMTKFLISTKHDCLNDYSSENIVKFIEKHHIKAYFSTSSLTGLNVELLFQKLAKELVGTGYTGKGGIIEIVNGYLVRKGMIFAD